MNSDLNVKKDKSANIDRPNILFAISDDQSFPHASAYGEDWIKTPGFDKVAKEGILFTNAFSASPGCSPSRAAILTGLNTWQLEQAGTHDSEFPSKYKVFPEILENLGYKVGFTGKGWGPGNWKESERERNPAGKEYAEVYTKPLLKEVSNLDYAENFNQFLSEREKEEPFYFWFGSREPHRVYEKGSGIKSGKKLESVTVPGFLPDSPEVRSDLLDYALEIEYFDQQLLRMLTKLESIGELENTIIIVTSDNGMAFPYAKANANENGTHVPLAIRWGKKYKGGKTVEDLISLIDIAPTVLEAAYGKNFKEIMIDYPMEGKSLLNYFDQKLTNIEKREAVFMARERHSSSRWNNLTYPQRSIRTNEYLYIRNFKPERWPAGAPQKIGTDGRLEEMDGGYHDIDASPTLDYMITHQNDEQVALLFEKAVSKRPSEELYDIKNDPYCLNNLAENSKYQYVISGLRAKLGAYLMQTEDPRVTGNGDIYETYKRYSHIRSFPEPNWKNDSSRNAENAILKNQLNKID
ncbi:sulfatase [Zunongwangia sp. M21534]|uniref:Sulfatase n=1 Tax=Zunongwangia pacifica TaxID=2911062 RepID=A0A9X1ZUW4_9FLAO|nr:sulfatase [Zunongwangia pacifica]MCL6220551.1 sulfatase [Zunongwangia pacifica]